MKKFIILIILIFIAIFVFDNRTKKDSIVTEPEIKIEEDTPDEKPFSYQGVIVLSFPPFITGDVEVDSYIQAKAEERGYELRDIADTERLVDYQNQKIQPETKTALVLLQEKMKEDNLSLTFVSGYRSIERQRQIFLNKLGEYKKEDILEGDYDEKINEILKASSIPGYSKHHSGYAIDVGCDSYELENSFLETDCYKWLSENDFENAKNSDFIPSYPIGVSKQGPDPESWEFVYLP